MGPYSRSDAIQQSRPNFFLDDPAIKFNSGGTLDDTWNDRKGKNIE